MFLHVSVAFCSNEELKPCRATVTVSGKWQHSYYSTTVCILTVPVLSLDKGGAMPFFLVITVSLNKL